VVKYLLMSTRTQEEATGPLGVIGCLAAGFEVLGRNLWLVVLPVLLDLLLWLGPRFSIVPLLHRFVALLMAQPTPDPATAHQVAQAVQLLEQFGEQFNLLSVGDGITAGRAPRAFGRERAGAASLGGSARAYWPGVRNSVPE
jgi:hypothetical protein